MRILFTSGLGTLVAGIDKDFNNRMPVLHEAPEGFHQAEGMLREEYKHSIRHHRPRFMNTAELMDPLESRHIDAIANNTILMDQVNYLRSYAVEECREIVCSTQGKKRFGECAESLLSTDKTCKVGCQDHLKMWVLKRCYMIETFDCGGNIGPNSVQSELTVFNQEGPQTHSQFTESITNLFSSKGIACECCDFSDVVVTKEKEEEPSGIKAFFNKVVEFFR
jgi:hypothetical protein